MLDIMPGIEKNGSLKNMGRVPTLTCDNDATTIFLKNLHNSYHINISPKVFKVKKLNF